MTHLRHAFFPFAPTVMCVKMVREGCALR